ncbi:MAG: hypothetical protein WC762_13700 [Methylobacter sp.]|jgi:hypothetical protein
MTKELEEPTDFYERMTLLLPNDSKAAMQAISQITNIVDAELGVRAALARAVTHRGLLGHVEAALQKFLDLREDTPEGRRRWLWCLNEFIFNLYEDRRHSSDLQFVQALGTWIKKFNQIVFKDAVDFGASEICYWFVDNFAYYAMWDDDPTEFHLTPENLKWVAWENHPLAKARIQAGRFTSYDDYSAWRVANR